jgi:hypothetical protein
MAAKRRKKRKNPTHNPSAGVVLGVIGLVILGGIGYAVWQVADTVKDVKNKFMLPANASNAEVRKRVRAVLVARGAELIKEKMLSGVDGDVDGRLYTLKGKPEVVWGQYLLVDPNDDERSGYVYAIGVKGKPIASASAVASPWSAEAAMSEMRSQITSMLSQMLGEPVKLEAEEEIE